MSDTPKTDEVMRNSSADAGSAWLDMRDHSRQLERELAAVTAERDALLSTLARVKAIANNIVYLDDSSDFRTGLMDVCKTLGMGCDEIGSAYIDIDGKAG